MAMRGTKAAGVAAALCLLVASAAAQGPQSMEMGRHDATGDATQRMVPAEGRRGLATHREAEPRGDGSRERGHRLSPEERRQLRRDVHEAGRDLYPGRMSAGRRQRDRE